MQSCHAPAIVGGIVLTTYHLISHWSLDVLGDLGVSPSIFFFEFVDPFGSGTLGSLVQYIGISIFGHAHKTIR